jgi:DNA-binding transcriptional LysR family regulator
MGRGYWAHGSAPAAHLHRGRTARLFLGAARELGYTQSAVSQHIAALEADLGVELLGRRPVAPTEAGARLLDHAGPLLTRLAAARADVVRVARTPVVRLAVGASPLAFGDPAARALARVRAALPRAQVSVRLLERAAVVRAVADGTLDVGLVDGAAAPTDPLHLPEAAGLSALGAGEEPLCVVLPRDHPLAARPGLRLTDLSDALWLDAPSAAVPLTALRAATGGVFRAGPVYEGTDTRTLHALAAAGHGLALLPHSAAPDGIPVLEPRLVHRVEAVHRASPEEAARLFMDALTAATG